MKKFTEGDSKNIMVLSAGILAVVLAVCLIFEIYEAVIPLIVMFAGFIRVNFYCSRKRQENLENISLQLDRILYGKGDVEFGQYTEGELSVLKNQLDKVVLRLHRQAEDLKKEKIKLTDSIADISHQLRTPLTSINLIISFLKKGDLPENRRIELAVELQRLANRIDWLINALLKISKIDAGTADFHKEKVTVKELVKKRAAPLEIGMDLKDLTLDVSGVGEEYFTGDLAWTAEAVGNLLKNCSEYTPVGGKITVKSEQTAVYTQIEITDSGRGFDKEDIPHLFTRFYKGKNASLESVGIGLALARMIISNQNGTIKADNHPSGGARFTVKFYHGVV